MRVLLYTPCYTIDRDAQSLRITMLAEALAFTGWQFDIVTTPVFFLGDGRLRMEMQRFRPTLDHLRVFLTHPGPVATLRNRLHRSGKAHSAPATVAERNGWRDGECIRLLRQVLRPVQGGYNQVFSRIGDPDWIMPAIVQGLRLASSRSHQLVFASASCYFASHIAAAIVSAVKHLPLVLDYGDPWGPEPPDRPKWLDRVSEAFVLRRAGRVVVTNDRARDLLLTHHSFLSPQRVRVITQGYSPRSTGDESSRQNEEFFTIAYTGNLCPGVRSSIQFFEALRAVEARGIAVKFVRAGPELPKEEAEWLRRAGGQTFYEDLGLLSHEQSLAVQRKATLLLVIGNRTRCQIPGKVVEYIAARRPVLCLSQGPDDLAAEFVKEHGLGIVVPNDAQSISEALVRLHHLWRMGELETIYCPKNVERFSWQSLAGHLEEIFREAVPTDRPASGIPAVPGDIRNPGGRSEATRLGGVLGND